MSVFKKLKEGIADLSELNVQTFTGNINSVIDQTQSESIIDWTKLLENARTSGEVKLMASSKIKFDGDSDTFFADEISSEILEAHMAAIEGGRKVREGLVAMFKGALGLE
jgi:hypothetical protein